jgi:hypothetical protein
MQITAENVLQLVEQLSTTEQAKLDQLLKQRTTVAPQLNGATAHPLKPIPMPDGRRERQWLAAHRRDYANQWVALDGDRLIAASPQHDEVWAAAQADGAYLPLITFIEAPDHITHILWA